MPKEPSKASGTRETGETSETAKAEKREIQLSFGRVLCSVHGEPLRVQWPKGYGILTLKLFERVAMTEEFADEQAKYRQATKNGESLSDADVLEALFDRVPLCCRVSPLEMLKAYEDANSTSDFARRAPCQACGRIGLGTSYRTQQGSFSHLCFRCVCKQARAHAERLN